MSDLKKELQELEAILLNIATEIGDGFKKLKHFTQTLDALDNLNQEAIHRNKKITVNELKLKQIQDKIISSPTDAPQAERLQQTINHLSQQNALLVKIQKALQKQVLLNGGELRSSTDVGIAEENLKVISKQLQDSYRENKKLKTEMKAHKKPAHGKKNSEKTPEISPRKMGKAF